MEKQILQEPQIQSSVSNDVSEIVLICWFSVIIGDQLIMVLDITTVHVAQW